MSCNPKTRDRVFLFAIFLMGLSFNQKISDFLNKQTTVTTECAGLYLFNVKGRLPRSRYVEDLPLAGAFDFFVIWTWMKNRKEINWATVEARLTAALFIGIPCYYGHFILVSHFLIYRTVTPVTTADYCVPLVTWLAAFHVLNLKPIYTRACILLTKM